MPASDKHTKCEYDVCQTFLKQPVMVQNIQFCVNICTPVVFSFLLIAQRGSLVVGDGEVPGEVRLSSASQSLGLHRMLQHVMHTGE